MSPAEVTLHINGSQYRRALRDDELAHFTHLLMNKMRQSKRDKAVKPDQIRRMRLPEEVPKEGMSERQRRIQEERSGVVDINERRRYMEEYKEKYGSVKPRTPKKKGGE